jgi:hypothetical protein
MASTLQYTALAARAHEDLHAFVAVYKKTIVKKD